MILRKETIADIDAITKVTIAAFKNLAVSNQTEQYIINALRDADALTLSLVAEIDGRVVGHILLSFMKVSWQQADHSIHRTRWRGPMISNVGLA